MAAHGLLLSLSVCLALPAPSVCSVESRSGRLASSIVKSPEWRADLGRSMLNPSGRSWSMGETRPSPSGVI